MPLIRAVDDKTFDKGWKAIAYLYPGLHPDGADTEGDLREPKQTFNELERKVLALEPRLIEPCYDHSGWPVILQPIAESAWERDIETYACDSQAAGICPVK